MPGGTKRRFNGTTVFNALRVNMTAAADPSALPCENEALPYCTSHKGNHVLADIHCNRRKAAESAIERYIVATPY